MKPWADDSSIWRGAAAGAWMGLLFGLAPLPAAAQTGAQPPTAGAAQPTRVDPGLDAAKRIFEMLSLSERQAIQDALVWSGDLNGTPDGTFGPRTYESIRAFQTRAKLPPNGILDNTARAGLLRAAERARSEAAFKIVSDAATGISIGIPERVLPKRDANPRGGTRWQSADGKITLDTRVIPPGETDLATLYERNLAIQTPGRQVTYKVLRPDFYVISGETAGGKFFTRFASGPDGIRGFSISYDKTATDFDRHVIAIANSFVPFPGAAQAQTAAVATPAPAAAVPRPVPAPPRPAVKPVLVATGLVVAPGQALTGSAIDGCPEIRVAGAKAQIARTDASGLRLLSYAGAAKAAALTRRPAAPDGEIQVVALTVATNFGSATPVAASGTIDGAMRLTAALQGGIAGAPVFDQGGALLGIVATAPSSPRQVAGVVPPMTYGIVPAADIARVAGREIVTREAGAEDGGAALAAGVAEALVAVECVR